MDNMAANQQIERYLLRQMDEQEASEFEAYYLSNNECIDQLEMAEKLLQGLRFAKQTEPVTHQIAATGTAANDKRWWQKKFPAWATAAMLMITLLPSALMYQELQQANQPSSELSVVSLPLTETRSGKQQAFSIPFTQQRLVLSIFVDTELEQMLYPSYAFQLTAVNARNESNVAESAQSKALLISDLKLDQSDMLYIDLGKSTVQAGEYQFSLLGINENNQSQVISSGAFIVE